ncbi:unnamed protein product [Paramecium octaurelia]|uniref:Uncharacterized protein n=1 Tax=Paramecium octaurelia TaxID=43137 RepID=A0A8S1V319_PAROT|nr:unnamed protein product [Paramecium octaurelia]
MIYCQHHAVFPISFICTASHQCQRLLCSECTQNHGVNQKFLLYLNIFSEKLKMAAQENNFVNNNIQRQQIHIGFKSLFHSIEILVKKMVENFNDEIIKLLKQIEIIDNKFETVLTKDTPLTEFSVQDLGFLIDIIMNKKLSTWNKQKNSIFQSLNTILKKLNENIQKKSFQNYQQQCLNQQEKQDIKGFQKNTTINSEKKKNLKKNRMCNDTTGKLINIQFGITFKNDNRIEYIKDGAIIRSDSIKEISKKPKVMTNMDQIMNLNWVGQYGQNNLKIGKWTIKWEGKILQDVGGEYNQKQYYNLNKLYSVDEKKQGKWKEIIKNYWSKAQVYKVGEYQNGLRTGKWKYIYGENVIGGGKYNEQGNKMEQWVELSSHFWDHSCVTYKGEYKNGIKVG